MSLARACAIGRHDCGKDYCRCPCHETTDGLAHSPQALLRYLVRAADDWVDRAACANCKHPDDWFPEAGSRRHSRQAENSARPAKRVCAGCPVRRQCLTAAVASENKSNAFGIWGGLRPDERWHKNVRDLPVNERIDVLMDLFDAQIPLLLSNRERRTA